MITALKSFNLVLKISLPTFLCFFIYFIFYSFIFFLGNFSLIAEYFFKLFTVGWPSCLSAFLDSVGFVFLLCLVTCNLQDNTRETKPRQWRKRLYKAGSWRLSPSLEGAKMQRAELLPIGVCADEQRRHFIHSLYQQVTRSGLFVRLEQQVGCVASLPKGCTRHT